MTGQPPTIHDLTHLLDQHPRLGIEGYDHPHVRHPDALAVSRERLAASLDEVRTAHAWLHTLHGTRVTADSPSSYSLKKAGEHAHGLPYVTNGAMITAALLAGIPIKITPGDPNPRLGVTLTPPRPRPPVGSFAAWLDGCLNDSDLIGDLARDAHHDDTWPLTGDYSTYYEYMSRVGASWPAMEALEQAWTSYAGKPPAPMDDSGY
jgi:hypothetical protein